MGTNTRADLQPQAPRLPRPRSLASYEEWRAHERQRRRSQSFGHIADVDDELLLHLREDEVVVLVGDAVDDLGPARILDR